MYNRWSSTKRCRNKDRRIFKDPNHPGRRFQITAFIIIKQWYNFFLILWWKSINAVDFTFSLTFYSIFYSSFSLPKETKIQHTKNNNFTVELKKCYTRPVCNIYVNLLAEMEFDNNNHVFICVYEPGPKNHYVFLTWEWDFYFYRRSRSSSVPCLSVSANPKRTNRLYRTFSVSRPL